MLEPQGELGIGEPQLARIDRVEIRAGLEVLGRDAQLAREPAQRLDRRLPRPRLDARDVGVRDPRRCELALRHSQLEPESLQALPNRLFGTRSGHH